ncbi:hypothetical protein [Actinacidiphila rubida]|uniref:Gram-positive cocci surface proteins LPxTG domain-containing protein n=1 Tax=Actinacidiphila rubida TaxID=310780 RepID=A0A1H8PUB8_9ACTN|nr:hypothetical protein [Actinacidiphila rubida]SEO45545.1 hypothetical protein SAMN05216267_10278 [Actinacidiphila rubida]
MREARGTSKARRAAAAGLALACGALGMTVAALGAAPSALAATPALQLDVTPTLYVEAGAAGNGAFVSTLIIGIGTTGQATSSPRHLVVDASALADRVVMTDLDTQDGCAAQELVVTCDLAPAVTRLSPFHLLATDSADAQFEADVPVTASTAGGTGATAHVRAVIGTPSLLTAVLPERRAASPGTLVPFSPVIANTGDASPRHGFTLHFHTSDTTTTPADARAFALTGERPANCHYPPAPRNDFWCAFPDEIAPGQVWTTDRPLSYRTRTPLMDGFITYDIRPAGSVLASQDFDPADYVTGDGPPLTLHRSAAQDTGLTAGWLHVVADQHADYQAIGGTLHGTRGDVVRLSLGVRNAGPGSLTQSGADGAFDVTLPAGVSLVTTEPVVASPPGTSPGPEPLCVRRTSGAYRCAMREPLRLHGQFVLRFALRIDRLVPAATKGAVGTVRVVPSTEAPTHDVNLANDTATITVARPGSTTSDSPTSGGSGSTTSGGSASGGSTSSGGGATGGSGASSSNGGLTPDGSLASTGSGATLPVTGAAAMLLLVGTVAVTVRRRRRL